MKTLLAVTLILILAGCSGSGSLVSSEWAELESSAMEPMNP